MARIELDIDPSDHLTADAIGKPGQRVFYIQARQADRVITLILEKGQLQSLAVGVEQFLAEVAKQNPDLPEASGAYDEASMRILPPVDPLFRVGEIGLGYDQARDRTVVILHELQTEEAEPDTASVVRMWSTRDQLRALARWASEVVERGRPVCTQCGQPIEPEGHFCPKKNGHKH